MGVKGKSLKPALVLWILANCIKLDTNGFASAAAAQSVKSAHTDVPPCAEGECKDVPQTTPVVGLQKGTTTAAYQPCDSDLCVVGSTFCWHSLDGEDDRQCVACQRLVQACSNQVYWGKLTDCLVYECLKPELAKLQAQDSEIKRLKRNVTHLVILSSCLGAALILLIVAIALYCWKVKSQRAANKDDTKSLISKDDSSQNDASSCDSANDATMNQNQNIANTRDDENGSDAAGRSPEAPEVPVHQADAESAQTDQARTLCSGLKHIPPTASPDANTTSELVTV